MKAGDRYGRDRILASIPHRGRNLVLDEIDFFDDGGGLKCRSRVTIGSGDAAGRDLFLQSGPEGPVYMDAVLVEHVALTSSVKIFPLMEEGGIAFFSTITNFRAGTPIRGGETVVAEVTPLGRRGPFHRSSCRIERPGDGMRVEMMAAVLPGGAGSTEGEKKKVEPPRILERRPVERAFFPYKDAAMVFVDEECALDRENRVFTGRYVYPTDHPFVPGHFPGNPVMMGVTQWVGMLDGAAWTVDRLDLGPGTWAAEGEILRADGSLVTEIKGLTFETRGPAAAPVLLETKRIGFRDVVRAGEEIFYRVALRPVPA